MEVIGRRRRKHRWSNDTGGNALSTPPSMARRGESVSPTGEWLSAQRQERVSAQCERDCQSRQPHKREPSEGDILRLRYCAVATGGWRLT